ncbi:unnamed protein product [Rotaria sordida]|uniref:Uncharacterized protein n=1 Tax=Rotaria sordida TaxID=392033 RepID=A0A813SXW8_9BILA|nr:unnamed protein product [Rotaria sordida]CAF3510939.1 unnamed protein product [Rotaria sordida]CAF3717920.1 unnamed protein product [Rotaria sordida]
MMNICEKYVINPCKTLNYCSNIDDYRPIQSTLLTRFTTTDCSELWRTTNQEYGAFYYQQLPQYCIPDNLKAKNYQRHNRFQDWLSYQNKYQNLVTSCTTNSNNNNNINQRIFPSDRNETVRITHRKKFLSQCNDELYHNQQNSNTSSPCGEDGLITEYIVKKILNKLRCLICPDEYHDVAECAQILVSEILSQEPCLLTNEIIDRVVTIMITPPNNIEQTIYNPCYSYISTKPICCPSPQALQGNCQTIQQSNIVNNETPICTTVNSSVPFINCNQTISFSNVFDKLIDLENAISKISNDFVKA